MPRFKASNGARGLTGEFQGLVEEPLEDDLHASLEDSGRIALCCDLSERCRGGVAGAGIAEVRVIEDVEGFKPERQVDSLADGEDARDLAIELESHWTIDCVVAKIPERSRSNRICARVGGGGHAAEGVEIQIATIRRSS